MTVHPGGKTALELLGDAHFLPLAGGRVTLFGAPTEKLPAWFRTHDWGVEVVYTTTNLFPVGSALGFTEFPARDLTLRMSGRERAMLELLHLVPERESFDEAKLLMEGLTTLRPAAERLFERSVSINMVSLADLYGGKICAAGEEVAAAGGYLPMTEPLVLHPKVALSADLGA